MARRSDDQAIIAAARTGDREAFEELVGRYRDRIFWLALQVVGNAEDAKDVSQNVLIRLWRKLDTYDDRYAFTTWLHRMTTNLAIDHLRRGAKRRVETALDDRLIAWLPAPAAVGGAQAAAAAEIGRIFAELRDLLPPKQRAVFALREIDGLSSEEVAAALELKPSTVRNHLFQARRTLRRELRKRYPDYVPEGEESES